MFWATRGVLKVLASNGKYQLLEKAEDDGDAARQPILNLQSW